VVQYAIIGDGFVAKRLNDELSQTLGYSLLWSINEIQGLVAQINSSSHGFKIVTCFSIFDHRDLEMTGSLLLELIDGVLDKNKIRIIDINSIAIFGPLSAHLSRGLTEVDPVVDARFCVDKYSWIKYCQWSRTCELSSVKRISFNTFFLGAVICPSRPSRFVRLVARISTFMTKSCVKAWRYNCSLPGNVAQSILKNDITEDQIVCDSLSVRQLLSYYGLDSAIGVLPVINFLNIPLFLITSASWFFGSKLGEIKGSFVFKSQVVVHRAPN